LQEAFANGCAAVKFNRLQLCKGIVRKQEQNPWKYKHENRILFMGYLFIGRMYH